MEVVFLNKLILSVVLTACMAVVLRFETPLRALLSKHPLFSFGLVFSLLRLLPFLIIFIWVGFEPRSDVPMFFESARAAQQGLFVYRDFESAYSPLFAYFTALPLYCWYSPEAIILLMIVIEGFCLWFTYRYFNTQSALFYSLIYLLLPAPFVLVVLGGQEDLWMWAFVLWAIWASRKPNFELGLGVILGLGLLSTKALFVLLLPGVFLFVNHRFKLVVGLLLVGIPALLVMYWQSGLLFLSPIQQANDPRTPNIWSILHPLTDGLIPLGPKYLNWIGLLSILTLSSFMGLRMRQRVAFGSFFPVYFIVTYVWLMVIQQSSLANYAYIYLMPLLFWHSRLQSTVHWFTLCLFNVVVVIQPPVWWGLGMPCFHTLAELTKPVHLLEFILEILLVLCLIKFLVELYPRITAPATIHD
jgi:hypothetical protein